MLAILKTLGYIDYTQNVEKQVHINPTNEYFQFCS